MAPNTGRGVRGSVRGAQVVQDEDPVRTGRGVWAAQAVPELPCRRCEASQARERKCQVFNLGGGWKSGSMTTSSTDATASKGGCSQGGGSWVARCGSLRRPHGCSGAAHRGDPDAERAAFLPSSARCSLGRGLGQVQTALAGPLRGSARGPGGLHAALLPHQARDQRDRRRDPL